MITDADLPPLRQLIPVGMPAATLTCLSDDALRAMQREAYTAGLLKAANMCVEWGNARKPAYGGNALRNCAEAIRALPYRIAANGAAGL